jgi:hypothetical protein
MLLILGIFENRFVPRNRLAMSDASGNSPSSPGVMITAMAF